jgi:iron complex outermembrane receptor protein
MHFQVAARPEGGVRKALIISASAMALSLTFAGLAHADTATADAGSSAPASPDAATPDYGTRVSDLTVVAEPGGAVAVQPVQAPLQSTEPTAVVTRQAIDQFVPQTADYSEVILLTPSMSGISQNGPGLYEAKSTLRGFTDGQYNVTYDGIPFGDTNDFTHHTTSFFPASNLGAISVERGPGEAGQLGEATFGGSVNIFSPEVSDQMGLSEQFTYGSWNTLQLISKLNTGDISWLGGTHAFIALTQLSTDGYLTNSGAYGFNEMIRTVTPIGEKWTFTFFSSINYTHVDQDDNNGATRAQVALYGKNFALTTNPTFNYPTQAALVAALNSKTGVPLAGSQAFPGTFINFNRVNKQTDFEYGRFAGDFTATTHFENTGYTYYYDNQTLSAQDVTGSAAVATHINPASQGTLTIGDVPGYTKLNHYRVYGDITRVNQDTPWGVLQFGVWAEHADTLRSRLDYDLTAGKANGFLTSVPDFHDPTKAQVPPMTAPANILYMQNSNFTTVQPYVSFDWKPIDALTITPGLKYMDFWRNANGPYNQGARNAVPISDHQSKLLYFLTANYRVEPNWSVYFQFATGFLQAPLSVLQNAGIVTSQLKPQSTTNYQLGTVYHSQKLTFDADIYYISFDNLLNSFTDPSGVTCPVNETCFNNITGATYKGFEGQATYGLTDQLFFFANGSLNRAINNRTGLQIASAPAYTFAAGGIWTYDKFKISLFDKLVGENHMVDATCTNATGACGGVTNLAAYNFYEVGAYNELDLTGVYTLGRLRLEAAIYNLLNSQQPYKITAFKKATSSLADPNAQFDQVFYQPAVNFQLSARYNF